MCGTGLHVVKWDIQSGLILKNKRHNLSLCILLENCLMLIPVYHDSLFFFFYDAKTVKITGFCACFWTHIQIIMIIKVWNTMFIKTNVPTFAENSNGANNTKRLVFYLILTVLSEIQFGEGLLQTYLVFLKLFSSILDLVAGQVNLLRNFMFHCFACWLFNIWWAGWMECKIS